MPNISASEVERVISALPNRRRIPNFGSRIRPHSSEFRAYQRKLVQQIKPILAKSIPFEKIDKIAADNEKERRQILEKEKADAYKLLPHMDTFRHAIDARFKAFELAKSAIVKPSTLVVLDTPFLIWTQPSNMLTASHIQARNSTAKVHYAVDSDSPDLEPSDSVIPLLSFYFQWENPGPNPVSLENVASHLAIKGLWEATAGSHPILPGVTDVAAEVNLNIYEWWNQPPTLLSDPAHLVLIFTIEIDGGLSWLTGKAQEEAFEWVFNGYDVKGSSLLVPPKGVVVFEVVLLTYIGFLYPFSAFCTADIKIEGSESSVICPFLQFQATEVIQSGPPLP